MFWSLDGFGPGERQLLFSKQTKNHPFLGEGEVCSFFTSLLHPWNRRRNKCWCCSHFCQPAKSLFLKAEQGKTLTEFVQLSKTAGDDVLWCDKQKDESLIILVKIKILRTWLFSNIKQCWVRKSRYFPSLPVAVVGEISQKCDYNEQQNILQQENWHLHVWIEEGTEGQGCSCRSPGSNSWSSTT